MPGGSDATDKEAEVCTDGCFGFYNSLSTLALQIFRICKNVLADSGELQAEEDGGSVKTTAAGFGHKVRQDN